MQPDGSGTGSSIERERHRTFGGVTYIVLGVRDVKHASLWRAILKFQQNRSGSSGVFYFLPANLDRVLRLNNFFLRLFLVFALFVGFIARLLFGFFSRLFTGLLARTCCCAFATSENTTIATRKIQPRLNRFISTPAPNAHHATEFARAKSYSTPRFR